MLFTKWTQPLISDNTLTHTNQWLSQ